LTGGGSGSAPGSSPTSDPFKPFSGVGPTLGDHSSLILWGVVMGAACTVLGSLGTLSAAW
jgi:hypothetical protein